MKRILVVIVVAASIYGALALNSPDAPVGPDFTGPVERESAASATASVWYCTWAASGALRDSTAMIAANTPVTASLTLPQQIVGEDPDTDQVILSSPGAVAVDVGEIVRRGDTPMFVEFDGGPAAVAVVVESDSLLTGDGCLSRIPKVWELPGGSTRQGRTTTIRLFNPFPEMAKVTVSGSSESGETGLVDLQSIDIPGRTWQDVELNGLIPLLNDLSFTVTTSEGNVVPSLVVAGSTDEASWPGEAPSTYWEFPVATSSADFAPSLMLSNNGTNPANATIDVYTADGATADARQVVVDPSIPKRIDLSDLADGAMGVRVRADAPVSAVVLAEESPEAIVATGETDTGSSETPGDRIAGTVGASTPASTWLLPGLQAVAGADSTVWLLNTGTDAATVVLQPLGSGSLPTNKQLVPPGTLLGVPLGYDAAVGGYFVESTAPISVAWSAEEEKGIMFVSGTLVDG